MATRTMSSWTEHPAPCHRGSTPRRFLNVETAVDWVTERWACYGGTGGELATQSGGCRACVQVNAGAAQRARCSLLVKAFGKRLLYGRLVVSKPARGTGFGDFGHTHERRVKGRCRPPLRFVSSLASGDP